MTGPAGAVFATVKILNPANYATSSSWTANYTASGNQLLVRAQMTGYVTGGSLQTYNLLEDGVIIDTNAFYFSLANVRFALPDLVATLPVRTGTHTYRVDPVNIKVDTLDSCTILI